MLLELHIESLGVIEHLDLVLGAGLTALTGETGAGKTMLVEAISLLVGGRADATMVRPGAAEARVEGRFVVADEEYIVARVIPADGRSRAYVNGRLATVGNLVDLGQRCVDIHGQHSHQSLLSAPDQRDALDRFCRTDLQPLRAARAHLTELAAALAALGGDSRSRVREVDLLRFQVQELQSAAITGAEEDRQLDAELDVLAGALEHREAGMIAVAALADDDGGLDAVGIALRALAGRAPFADLEGRLHALSAEMSDVVAELRTRADGIEEDPERLAAVRDRLQLLRDLRRKYGETLLDVLAFQDEVETRLAELEGYELRVEQLEHERALAETEERRAAAAVAATRRGGAGALAAAVQEHLRALAMPHASVAVTVGDHDPGDEVAFLLAANPGSPLLPLARVASGGELARSMLALRLVLTEAPDTLVFDEVDAGIGGSAAVAVGSKLAQLGTRHQVLVVTHLAQVAAFADCHIVVSKQVRGELTVAAASAVSGDDRVEEVARMLSGDQ
ncbi:MAG: DNA repair protein RecN, partial [Actinobacteria bacterium]|nr:DNA repair protein RecN [Actinomycetota bacterium]